jgi:hypothetical protein
VTELDDEGDEEVVVRGVEDLVAFDISGEDGSDEI